MQCLKQDMVKVKDAILRKLPPVLRTTPKPMFGTVLCNSDVAAAKVVF